MRRLLGHAAIVLITALLVISAAVLMISPRFAEYFVFFPARMGAQSAPVLAGVSGQDVWLSTGDAVRIHGWWFDAGAGSPVLLVLHGNAGHIGDRTPIAEGLLERRVSVFLLDYRGYGQSEGRPTEEGVRLDALAAYEFAAAAAGRSQRLVLFGQSLGGAVAAQLAAERPVGGLILESTFTSLEDMARAAYPFLPGFTLRRLRGHFDTRAALARVRAPIQVVHGARDEIVPLRMGRELFETAPGSPTWLEVQGAGHNDVFYMGGDRYFDDIVNFVREAVGDSGQAR